MNKYEENREDIVEFGRELMNVDDISDILALISEKAKSLLAAKRCSIFVVDKDNDTLWTKLSDGIEMIVIPLDSGIVGDTYKTKKPQIVNSPYDDERFMSNIDKKVGHTTINIITVPIFDSKKEVIAIIQLLNKLESDFDNKDLAMLSFFANFVSGSIELSLMSDWF